MINSIDEILLNVKNIGITGHVRPDGDCVGSTLGLYNYICDNYKNIEATVYLEEFEKCFSFINGSDKVLHDCDNYKNMMFLLYWTVVTLKESLILYVLLLRMLIKQYA